MAEWSGMHVNGSRHHFVAVRIQRRQHTGKEQAGGESLKPLVVELAVGALVVVSVLADKHACTYAARAGQTRCASSLLGGM